MLEVNAAYGDTPSAQLLEQPILVCSAKIGGSQLEGYGLAGTLIALEVHATPFSAKIWIEQVAWTQAPRLATVWCEQNDASDWSDFTARELAHSLERHPDLLAYLAYLGDDAVGMMVASSDGICGWWAGADDVAFALFSRAAGDLGRVQICVPLERRRAFLEARATAGFEIFITGNSDQRSFEASR